MKRLIGRSVPTLIAAATMACAGTDAVPTSVCHVAELDVAVYAGAEGDGFIAIGGIAVGSDGTAYILDAGEGSLTAFAPEGDELWRVRGAEVGFEEFDNPAGLHRQRELLVFEDLARRRLSFWTEFGDPAGSLELDSLGLPGDPTWVAALGQGRVAAAIAEEPLWDGAPPLGGVLVVSRGNGRVDTVTAFTFPAPEFVQLVGYELPVAPPYSPQFTLTASPDGVIALARGEEYLVELFDADGRPLGEIRGADDAPAVTDADRRAFGRLLPDTLLVSQLDFPATHPAITRIAATADGHLLVRTSWTRRDEVRWDRWTLAGEFVNSFMLPSSMLLVGGVGNLVYGRAVDESGANHLEVYRVTRETSCPGTSASAS